MSRTLVLPYFCAFGLACVQPTPPSTPEASAANPVRDATERDGGPPSEAGAPVCQDVASPAEAGPPEAEIVWAQSPPPDSVSPSQIASLLEALSEDERESFPSEDLVVDALLELDTDTDTERGIRVLSLPTGVLGGAVFVVDAKFEVLAYYFTPERLRRIASVDIIGGPDEEVRSELVVELIEGTQMSTWPLRWELLSLSSGSSEPTLSLLAAIPSQRTSGSKYEEYHYYNEISFPARGVVRVHNRYLAENMFPEEEPWPITRPGERYELHWNERTGAFHKCEMEDGELGEPPSLGSAGPRRPADGTRPTEQGPAIFDSRI